MHQPHRAVFRSTVGPPDSRHPATGRRATPPYPRLRVEESERFVACGVRIQARASTPHRTEFSARAFGSSSSMPHGNLARPRYDAPATTGLRPTRSGRNNPARIRASASNAPAVTVQPPLPSHHRRTARLFGRRGPTTQLAWRTANSQSQESKGPTSPTSPTSPTRRMRGTRTTRPNEPDATNGKAPPCACPRLPPGESPSSRDFSVDQGKSGHLRDRPGQGAEDEQYGNGAEGGRAVEGGGGCAESA